MMDSTYMIGSRQSTVRSPDRPLRISKTLESLLLLKSAPSCYAQPLCREHLPERSLHAPDDDLSGELAVVSISSILNRALPTDIQQDGSIGLLINNVVLEDLIVQSARLMLRRRHSVVYTWCPLSSLALSVTVVLEDQIEYEEKKLFQMVEFRLRGGEPIGFIVLRNLCPARPISEVGPRIAFLIPGPSAWHHKRRSRVYPPQTNDTAYYCTL